MALDREQVGLLFKIQADSSEAQRALTQFKGTVNNAVGGIKSDFSGMAQSFLSSTSSLTTGLDGLVAGLTGVAGVAAAAAAALGGLAISTTEYASHIADLSAKTNLSTDTLQSLKLAATLTGQSFESVSETAVIFQRRIEEARGGNEKLKATFDALHINLTGPVDTAFRQTLERLSTVEDGAQKTATAVDLFGRSGANLLPIMQQVGGSFQNLEDRARELGIILDKEAIQRADEFGDQVDLLKLQLGGLANQIGSLVIPAFSNFTKSISETIHIFTLLGNAAESTFTKIQRMLFVLKSFSDIRTIPQGIAGILGAPGLLDQVNKESSAGGPPVTLPTPTGRGGRAGRAPKPETVKLPIKDFSKLVDDYFKQLDRLEEEQIKRMEQAQARSVRVQQDILRTARDREIDAIRDQIDQRIITEEEGAARIAAVRVAAFAKTEDELRAKLDTLEEDIGKAQSEFTARPFDNILKARLAALEAERDLVRNQITLIQDDRSAAEEEGNRNIAAARDRDLQDLLEAANEQKRIYKELEKARIKAESLSSLTTGLFGEAFTEKLRTTGSELAAFGALFKQVGDQLAEESARLGSLAETGFGAFTNALTEMAVAFALTGQTGPAALRQLAAGVLAALAKMAATKAIYELAEGFAALARGFFGDPRGFVEAGHHFTAAAIYGSVAALAGIGARTAAPASSGGGGVGGGAGSSGNDRRIIEQGDRQRPQPQIIIIRAETEPGVVVRKVIEDYHGNGATRQVLRRDMLGDGG